jgi:tRNA(fMet)-specific endonuclease VapC
MSGKLLDTNAIVALQKEDPAFLALLQQGDDLFIPAVVIGGLYYGAANSGRVIENTKVIDDLVAENVILGCDTASAKLYGQIRHQLRLKGRPLLENDIWIAAITMQHGLTLVTRDAHFQEIAGLTVQSW